MKCSVLIRCCTKICTWFLGGAKVWVQIWCCWKVLFGEKILASFMCNSVTSFNMGMIQIDTNNRNNY